MKKTLFQYKEEIKLDKKDKRILYELYKNARTPINNIAKQVNLSKDTIKYRIKRLEKIGLILGYTTVINLTNLGYHWNILLLQTKFESAEQEQSFIELLKNSKNILKVMKCSGKWEYQIDIIYSSLTELTKIINKIKESTSLLNFSVLNCLKEIKYSHLPQVFFTDLDQEIKQAPAGRIDETEEKIEINEIDLQIIKLLIKNSRTSLVKLSQKINLSPDAINNRIKKLEESIIKGYMPIINTALLYDEHWIFLQTNKSSKTLIQYLKQHPNIQAIYEIGYDYNLFFWITTTNIGEYEKILTEIKQKFTNTINKIDSTIALKEEKYTEFPGIEEIEIFSILNNQKR
jgi:DNA-binding Lrp family transcriptional regulator